MFDFLKSGRGRQELTSLNLDTPAKIPSQNQSTPSVSPSEAPSPAAASAPSSAVQEYMRKFSAAARDSGVMEEIGRRTRELLASGQKPELICFLRDRGSHNPVALLVKEPPRNCLLLFNSPLLAHFYARTQQMPFEVTAVKLEEIEPLAQDWRKRGFNAFILDLSPKAPVFNMMTMKDDLITAEQLMFAWANGRTIRNWQAQRQLAEFYSGQNTSAASPETLQRQRAALESLRDFGSFDVPFVHWMIALIAGMQGDEAGRLAATATLESFGPDFVGKTARLEGDEGLKAWAHSWSTATIGLLAEYGMLKAPHGTPIGSILRTRQDPPAATS